MAKLTLVKPTLTEEQHQNLISEIRAGARIVDLEKKYGLTRQRIKTIRTKLRAPDITLQSRAGLNPVTDAPRTAKPPPTSTVKPKPIRTPIVQIALAAVIILISLTLGGVGLVLNWQFAVTLGQSPLSSSLLGVLGAAIDLVTIFIMAIASLLWDQRRYGQFILAIAIGLLCFALSTIAAMSFAASNVGDSLQGREAIAHHHNALMDQLNRLKSDRMRTTENRDPQILEQQIQTARGGVPANRLASSKDCTDVTISLTVCDQLIQLRSAKRSAEVRVELDQKLSRISDEIAALPPVAVKDPGASQISKLTYGYAGTEEVESFRLIGFAFMPSLAGFLLAFARTILR